MRNINISVIGNVVNETALILEYCIFLLVNSECPIILLACFKLFVEGMSMHTLFYLSMGIPSGDRIRNARRWNRESRETTESRTMDKREVEIK